MMSERWDADQYLVYESHRTRPCHDLIQQIPDFDPDVIFDLGCGTGTSTAVLRDTWPNAHITGIDSSQDMLNKAMGSSIGCGNDIEWCLGKIETLFADTSDPLSRRQLPKPDLIFSNAALQWVPNHAVLIPQLLRSLNSGGVLAVQQPNNYDALSHRLIENLARSEQWSNLLADAVMASATETAQAYYQMFDGLAQNINIWETEYCQMLHGADAVFEWVKGTTLLPYLAKLPPAQGKDFCDSLKLSLRNAYPPFSTETNRDAKMTLFPFKRLFFVIKV